MDNLSTIGLNRCSDCGNIVREDAVRCWACKKEAPEIANKSSAISQRRLQRTVRDDGKEHQKHCAFESLVQLALAGAPWHKVQGLAGKELSTDQIELEAEKRRIQQPNGELLQYPKNGWLRALVMRMQPTDSELQRLMLDILFLDTTLSISQLKHPDQKDKFSSQREQMLIEGYEIMSEYSPCLDGRSSEEGAHLLLGQVKQQFAKQLCRLLTEWHRPDDAERYRKAAEWTPDIAALEAKQRKNRDSGRATHFEPGPDPDNPESWPTLGDMCFKLQLYDDALVWYQRDLAYQDDTKDNFIKARRADILGVIGRTLLAHERYFEAEHWLEESLSEHELHKLDPCPLEECLDSGRKEIIRHIPVRIASARLAFAKSMLGKDSEAETYYRRAISLFEADNSRSHGLPGNHPPWMLSADEHLVATLKGYLSLLEKQQRHSEAVEVRQKLEQLKKYEGILP